MKTNYTEPLSISDKQQKLECKQKQLLALQWLATKFPEAFECSNRIRPLKIGILKDILSFASEAHMYGISKSKIREALVLFTRKVDYLACLKCQEMRIDLYGNATSRVTAEEAHQARIKLNRRAKKTMNFHQNNRSNNAKTYSKQSQKKLILERLHKKLDLSTL